jgi:RNA polymerase sigma-70 factor (ECF subfamily)
MDLKLASDEALVKAFQRKQVEALEEFYDRHHRTALAVAYRVLGDADMAEDVTQEAFLAVWRQADAFSPERGQARAWFLSIVRHRAIDVTRGRAFSRERIFLDEASFEDVGQEALANIEKEQIRNAVNTLPAEQREAVTLAYFGGYTHQEIAERTGVPLGTVKGRMRLAMQKLRSALTEIQPGGTH